MKYHCVRELNFISFNPLFLALHCVDRIHRDTPSARIDRLIPILKQPFDGRLHTGKRTSVSQPPAYGCLTGY